MKSIARIAAALALACLLLVAGSPQADCATGYSHTFANSFYTSSAPSFFSHGATCTYPWPWIDPSTWPYVKTNSCGGSGLPAQARWNAGTPFVQP